MLHRLFMCGASVAPPALREGEDMLPFFFEDEPVVAGMWESSGPHGPVEVQGGGFLEVDETDLATWMFSEFQHPVVSMWEASGPHAPVENPSPPSAGVASGVGWGGSSIVENEDPPYTAFLNGRQADVYSDYLSPFGTIGINGNWTFVTSPNTFGQFDNYGNWLLTRPDRRMEIALGPMPWTGAAFSNPGGFLAEVGQGLHDAKFVTMATGFKNLNLGGSPTQPVYIRLMWEHELSWSWACGTDPTRMANFVLAWQKIVDAMRSVSGTNFKFAFCPSWHTYAFAPRGPAWITATYPGNAHVDLIGADVYDAGGPFYPPSTAANRSATWTSYHQVSLQAMNDFAESKGKPQMMGEWGVWHSVTGTDIGGNDNPDFIQNIYDWVQNHNFEYVNYFEDNNSAAHHRLNPSTEFPNASLKFRQTFGVLPHPF